MRYGANSTPLTSDWPNVYRAYVKEGGKPRNATTNEGRDMEVGVF